MKHTLRNLALGTSVALLLAGSSLSSPHMATTMDCEGCVRDVGESETDNWVFDNTYYIKVSAAASSGQCVDGPEDCVGSPCEATITFEWRNFGQNVSLCEQRVDIPGQLRLCGIQNTNSGVVENKTWNKFVPCGVKNEYSIFASMETDFMSASTHVECSACE